MKQFYLNMIMLNIMMILVMVSVLISVAFLTLLERKFLGYIQIRKGPNKLGILGLLQPFSDAIKLMMKEFYFMNKLNYLIYVISPMFSLILILMMWMIYPFWSNYLMMMFGLLYLMCCLSLSVYGMLLSGWSSNSSYSMLGSLRSLAQSISYEVSLSIIMIIPMLLIDSMNFMNLSFNLNNWMIIYMWPLGMVFLFSIMAELNRTPFDFSEGESELVSGFNVEFMSSGFVLLFLSEYASIIFLSFLFNLIFFSGNNLGLEFFLKMLFMVILIIWVRGTLPRFRYDLLMYFCWLMILPFSLNYMFYMVFFKILV
uniref:NADH-ubiquinone oxidoreductase chain 1 n=1 Tax=Amblyjoppa sp. ZJUH_2016002 TaxID=2491150 RepID=A0A3Q8U9U0_9HYME|nr:NADH dehydrogenase subunit 1 [Amblyjoppa sp. ZJUH_2016002]